MTRPRPPPPPPTMEKTPLPPLPPPPVPPPPPPSTYKFKIENREVRTTVIATESDLSSCLSDFLTFISADRQIKRIVGLDIQISYSVQDPSSAAASKVAVLKLCAGRRCLLIQLLQFKAIPSSLACFLDLPDLSFIGIGIKRCLAALERDYGLGCRNSVDLGQLVATVKDKPYMTAFGLVDLANEVGLLNVTVKASSAALSDWGGSSLSTDQVKAATVDAFLCFHIGNLLLGGIN